MTDRDLRKLPLSELRRLAAEERQHKTQLDLESVRERDENPVGQEAFDHWGNVPGWIEASSDETRAEIVAETDRRGAQEFRTANPDYHQSGFNFSIIKARLQGLPLTFRNLTIAYDNLHANGMLEVAPPPEQPVVDKWAGITLARTDALAHPITSREEKAQLAKLVDDPGLSDVQRKNRLKKLAQLAREQRRGG